MRKSYRSIQKENEELRRKLEARSRGGHSGEEAVEQAYNYLRQLFMDLPWEVFIIELSADKGEFVFREANRSAVEGLGIEEDVGGKKLKEIFPRRAVKALVPLLQSTFQTSNRGTLRNINLTRREKRDIETKKLTSRHLAMICRKEERSKEVGSEGVRREESKEVGSKGVRSEESKKVGSKGVRREESKKVGSKGVRREESKEVGSEESKGVRSEGVRSEESKGVGSEGVRREESEEVRSKGVGREESKEVRSKESEGIENGYGEKYRDLLLQSPMGIMELNPDGDIMEYNSSAAELLKLKDNKSANLYDLKILEYTSIPERFDQCIERQELVQGEDWITGKKGESIPVKYQFSPLKSHQAETYGIIGVFDDLSRIREIEDQLRQSNQHYRDLVTLLPEVIFEADKKGNISFVNEKAYEIFEFSRDELQKGFDIFTILAREDRDRARRNFRAVATGQYTSGNEYTAICKSGRRLPVLVYSNPITEGNEITGIRGIVVTINEIKEAEKALVESEEKFRQLAENINDAFWLCNLNGHILYANPACARIAERGIPHSSPYTDIFFSWIHPQDKSRTQFEILKNQENPEAEHVYEHRIITPKGHIKWVWVRISPVFDNQNKIYRKAGIASDITHSKNLINELIVAKEKAEKADRLKSSFLANMSHEIRTPMNGIMGFTDLLKAPDLKEEDKNEYLGIIEKNGKQLLNLMNDIIDIAKIEAGEMTLHRKRFDLNRFLSDIYQTLRRQYEDKLQHIELKLYRDTDQKVRLYSDPGRLNQVLTNLLVNAFKYTEKGTIEFGYRLNYTVNRVNYVKFFVTDTGKGIDKKHQELIFERFGQVREKDDYKPDGTGLGLSISRNLVHLLEGRIWFESEKNKGTSFYFIIPDIREEEEEKPEKTGRKQEPEKDQAVKTILIVEDDLINQKYLEKVLQKKNIRLLDAKTGEKALEMVRQNPWIDLVLMDIRLPGMNGYETTKAIKNFRQDLPVIAQTAYAMHNDYSKALAMGCDDYISKPIDQNVLFEKLNHYLYVNKNS